MENAVEALKIAFAVLMFVMALSLSISSFSQANSAIDAVINMRDRENEYTYVEPTKNLSRTVGIETIVSSMYRAFEQNIEIYFKDEDGNTIPLFYKTDISETSNNYLAKDDITGMPIVINSIDDSIDNVEYDKMHLDIILGGTSVIEDVVNATVPEEDREKYIEMYTNKIKDHYPDGLYEKFKNTEFIELFGEYYQNSGASEFKKRVITYQILPN